MGSCSNLGRGLEEDLSWASGDDGVLASRAGKGSEELLKFLEDLDLHVWEEIDPKTYMEVFKRFSGLSGLWCDSAEFLQNARSSNFGKSKLDVRPNSARPNSGRSTSERSSNSGEIGLNSGLTKFFELQGDCYPSLVKVFYANLKREMNYLISRVKGVTIRIDDSIWKYVARFKPGGLKAHHGILGFNKVDIYNHFLKDQDMIVKYDSLSIDHLSKEERICAYVITWILLPRGEDQSLLNAEDVYLLIMRLQNVDTTNDIIISCKEGWIFKDEYCPSTDEVNPINIYTSRYKFRPQTRFEEFVDERFKRLDEKMSMLQRSFTELHRKIDYALRINAFGDTSVDDSESEKNSADEKIVESSETG
ncbi:hypothetical protein LR48_Vigan11g138100 [Vigna angularis]|uniref:Uncharacterized protein n=1 Tax=Phaseolus angularis TaxID=3914 RepID=A0A0L9VU10_PHAAN|nr:hypothetical protein LR48_Vigan11g138100 [Vigna angularis]